MIKSVFVMDKHQQISALSSKLKYNILKELISGTATCQQLAEIFNGSKQMIHYNLKQLINR